MKDAEVKELVAELRAFTDRCSCDSCLLKIKAVDALESLSAERVPMTLEQRALVMKQFNNSRLVLAGIDAAELFHGIAQQGEPKCLGMLTVCPTCQNDIAKCVGGEMQKSFWHKRSPVQDSANAKDE